MGELTLVSTTGRAFGHVCADLYGHEGTSRIMAADLGDVHDVQYGVDLPVTAAARPVAAGPTVALT